MHLRAIAIQLIDAMLIVVYFAVYTFYNTQFELKNILFNMPDAMQLIVKVFWLVQTEYHSFHDSRALNHHDS